MDRRNFVAMIGAALAAPRTLAQQKDRVYRLGAIGVGDLEGLTIPQAVLLRADRVIE